jgi:hypothetical protein
MTGKVAVQTEGRKANVLFRRSVFTDRSGMDAE